MIRKPSAHPSASIFEGLRKHLRRSANFAPAGKLLLLNFAALIALLLIEVISAPGEMTEEAAMPIAILLSLAALPVILTTIAHTPWARWVSLTLSGLLTLFHGLHVFGEHLPSGDHLGAILITATMLVPCALAVWRLWQAK